MNDDYRTFKITGGAIKAAHDRWIVRRTEALATHKAIMAEFGASNTYGSEYEMTGLVFENGDPPKGWNRVKNAYKTYWPSGKTKEGRELRKRLRGNPMPGADAFQREVLGGEHHSLYFLHECRARKMGIEKHGDTWVLLVPRVPKPSTPEDEESSFDGWKWSPPDEHCIELKASEYWKLKEDAEASNPPTL